jgi:hypothetical protein
MRCFGLTPDQISARAPKAGVGPGPSRFYSIAYGAGSLGVVSALAYSIWAFGLIRGAAPMYASIAAVYLGLAGIALGQLVRGPGSAGRFALLFAVAFLLYAIVWCAGWFGLGGKYHGDYLGSFFGVMAMVWLIRSALQAKGGFVSAFVIVFVCHTIGYAVGGELHAAIPKAPGRLLWGAAHGLGFGAGLGYLLHHCQWPRRAAPVTT